MVGACHSKQAAKENFPLPMKNEQAHVGICRRLYANGYVEVDYMQNVPPFFSLLPPGSTRQLIRAWGRVARVHDGQLELLKGRRPNKQFLQ